MSIKQCLTLEKALKIASSMTMSQQRIKQLNVMDESKEAVKEVLAVQSKEKFNSRGRHQGSYGHKNHQSTSSEKNNQICESSQSSQSSRIKEEGSKKTYGNGNNFNPICSRCGQSHKFSCPAKGIKCHKCNLFNHFAKFCKTKMVNQVTLIENNSNDDDLLFIGSITDNNKNDVWQVVLKINNGDVNCQLDTGAQANIMSIEIFNKMNLNLSSIVKQSNVKLMAFNSNKISTLGKSTIKCFYKQKYYLIEFFIVDFSCNTILGLETSNNLNLISRINVINNSKEISILDEYEDLFEGLGCLPITYHIHLDTNIQPKIDPPRRVPFNMYDKLESELKDMVNMKVIKKVNAPTSWVNSIVIVIKKNNKLRICLDPRNLNKAIKRSHYPLPNFENVKSRLNGSCYFSTLDASSGFWMVPLDEESANLCTFNTPFGRYKLIRLPYGLNCASEVFHRVMTEHFSDIDGVFLYVDDLIIFAKNKEQHDLILKKVFERARQINIKFNKIKCHIGVQEVKFLGHIFNKNGVKPDNEKVKAINLPTPKCVKDLQRFLGMINYLGAYIPNLASESSILRDLLKKNSLWQWDENYEKAFCHLKNVISTFLVLNYFDCSKPITLSVDASQNAVGAVLLQDNKPCGYASKSLTESQQNFAQIEKELYAIMFGCTKFHQYLYGQTITVQTDHKPLITLFTKPLHSVPVRLQRMMLKLQSYDLKVKFVPGKLLIIADTLSRAALKITEVDEIEDDIILHV